MQRWSTSALVVALFPALLTASCGAGERRPLPGNYRFVGSADRATLELRSNGTYRFCIQQMKCETEKYRFESVRKQDFDRIFFHGPTMDKFSAGGWGTVTYGRRCPCIEFDDPDTGTRFEKITDKEAST